MICDLCVLLPWRSFVHRCRNEFGGGGAVFVLCEVQEPPGGSGPPEKILKLDGLRRILARSEHIFLLS